jgi:hypothetical protein
MVLEDQGEDWRTILKWRYEGVEWIYLAQDRDRWQVLVNTVNLINFRIP